MTDRRMLNLIEWQPLLAVLLYIDAEGFVALLAMARSLADARTLRDRSLPEVRP